ncbi:MAG: HAD-IA family hydrolase [Candidatus Aenigmarchaeota archaeon]|nr:HAD-IA family hydrolase [Candidatus Aenigmarchaeota archaeon]
MKLKAVIFDFDGTIADSLVTGLEIFNRLSKKYGYKEIKDPEKHRNMTARELIKELGISIYKIPFIEREVKFELNKEIRKIKIFPGLKDVFTKLEKNKIKLGILTTNTEKNVEDFLDAHKLKMFEIIIAKGSLFGKHKLMKELIKNSNLAKDELIYVGDEIRDIEAAKKTGIRIVSVTWGTNSKKSLEKMGPDYIIEKPEELLELVKKL